MTTLKGKVNATRLDNLDVLRLPMTWKEELKKIIHLNRMYYEPWIESANSFKDLKSNLKKRGYSNLPITPGNMLNLNMVPIKEEAENPNVAKGTSPPKLDPRVVKNIEKCSKCQKKNYFT